MPKDADHEIQWKLFDVSIFVNLLLFNYHLFLLYCYLVMNYDLKWQGMTSSSHSS